MYRPNRNSLALALAALLTACGGEADTGDSVVEEGCGAEERFDVTVIAKVVGGGAPLEGIEVVLEERNWEPGEKGMGVTGSDGIAAIEATDLVSIPNCWGTRLNYQLVASDPAGVWGDGEKGVNSYLFNSIEDGSGVAEIVDFPIELE